MALSNRAKHCMRVALANATAGDEVSAAIDAAGNSALVVDAINNGVTTSAPSQNAVYDALALKQDVSGVAAAITARMVVTGTVAPTLVVPAFVGQIYVDTTHKLAYIAIEAVAGGFEPLTAV